MTRTLAIAVVALAAIGCAAEPPAPDLVEIYGRAAGLEDPARNPLVIVPAFMGSVLADEESGRYVWGRFDGDAADSEEAAGARRIAHPMALGVPLAELRDEIVPTSILDRVQVPAAGIVLEMGVYHDLLEALDRLDGVLRFHPFPYDWRRDLVENVRRFHAFLLELREREGRAGRPGVRFDVVTHSAGALLVRYYLRYGTAEPPPAGSAGTPTWAGAALVDRVVLVNPPNAGTLRSLEALVHGRDLGCFLPRYAPAVVGTMPGAYPLLPRARHRALVLGDEVDGPPLDPLDVAVWKEYGWGLADPGQAEVLAWLLPDVADPAERRRIALDHLEKCLDRARRIQAVLDVPSRPPAGTSVHLLGTDTGSAPAVAGVDPRTGEVEFLEWRPGDGTVLRTSQLLDERAGGEGAPRLVSPIRWAGVAFVGPGHLEAAASPIVIDNLLFLILEDPR